MNLGTFSLETIRPNNQITEKDGKVIIKPFADNEKTLEISVPLFIRNYLLSMSGIELTVLPATSADSDYAQFAKGKLIGRFDGISFAVRMQSFYPVDADVVALMTEQAAQVFAGENAITSEAPSFDLAENTKLEVVLNTGIFAINHQVGENQYSLALHAFALLPSLIESVKEKDYNFYLNPTVLCNGMIYAATIQSTLLDGVAKIEVESIRPAGAVIPEKVLAVSDAVKQFQPLSFEIDFKKFGLDKELLEKIYTQNIQFYINLKNAELAQVRNKK